MKIVNLMEDTKGDNSCVWEHGLSFYIETKKHTLLVDTGASEHTWENARRLGVDITKVDMVILSHGHYDHTGGVMSLTKQNQSAKIYMQRTAGDDYYHMKKQGATYIGIDREILKLPQLVLLDGDAQIDQEISVFCRKTEHDNCFFGNRSLKKKVDGQYIQDNFNHEQYAVLCEGKKKILISGCAHNGILNIMERYREIYGGEPDIAISGFHLIQKAEYTSDEVQRIKDMAAELKKTHTIFYTGHCTGEGAYQIMKEIMGNQLLQIHCGEEI